MHLDEFTKLLEAAKDLATVVALVFAGLWTYLLYVKERIRHPRLALELHTSHTPVPDGSVFIHAEVRFTNVGKVILKSDDAELRLRQILPVPDEVESALCEGTDIVSGDAQEVDWPMLAQRTWTWPLGTLEIEPGEADSVHADFHVSPEIQVVQFYFYLNNPTKPQGIGWSLTQIDNLKERTEQSMADRPPTDAASDLIPLQGKKKPPQMPTERQLPRKPPQKPQQPPKKDQRKK